MFLDASAIIAILAREADAAALTARLEQAERISTSPVAVYETVLGLARIGNLGLSDAQSLLDRFLEETGAQIVPITNETARRALHAFDRFGKGRHSAGLNMGDCFAYACVEQLRAPLLYKGDDFPLTDVSRFDG